MQYEIFDDFKDGMVLTAIPVIGGGVDYKTFTFNAEKGI